MEKIEENMQQKKENTWFKNHADTLSIISVIVFTVMWMNGQFNAVDNRFSSLQKEVDDRFSKLQANVDTRFSTIEKDIGIIKTVLIMKNIMPTEICHQDSTQKVAKGQP